MRIYLAPKVLIIDEMGYLPLDDLGATIFFQLVSARYERGSIILTSNKSYGEWGSIFGDPIIATAILDRLAASLDDGQHPRRELPAQGTPQSRADSAAGTSNRAELRPALPSSRGKQEAFVMSFLRHRQIYRSDVVRFRTGSESSFRLRPGSHRLDESAAGYSLAGCSPAEPASASPAGSIFNPTGWNCKPPPQRGLGNFRPVEWGFFNRY